MSFLAFAAWDYANLNHVSYDDERESSPSRQSLMIVPDDMQCEIVATGIIPSLPSTRCKWLPDDVQKLMLFDLV